MVKPTLVTILALDGRCEDELLALASGAAEGHRVVVGDAARFADQILSKLPRDGFALQRDTVNAWLRRTVARDLIFSRKSCFTVSDCPCSCAYPISMTISKSLRRSSMLDSSTRSLMASMLISLLS